MKKLRKRTRKLKQGIYLLPNFFTSVNLFLGFFAIIQTFKASENGDTTLYSRAAMAIIVAIIFDVIDGRVARLTKTTSSFGQEYDSLADLTTFGLAPALLMHSWGLNYFGRLGWLAVFLYFACVALRLARFNTQSKTVEKEGFQGLPSPAAAALVASIILVKPVFLIEAKLDMIYILFLPYVLAVLMVSNVKYRNFKAVDLRKRFSFSVVLSTIILIIIIAYKPIYTIFILSLAYFASGMIEAAYRLVRKKKSAKESEGKTAYNTDNNG